MTPAGVARLKLDEACRLQAYPDPDSGAEPWTIGFGCTGPGIGPKTRWTMVQAEAALAQRIQQVELQLVHALPWLERLRTSSPVRSDVLTNIAFNVGVAGLEHWPVTLKAVELGHYAEAGADIRGNAKWRGQVHGRDDRCAAAMRFNSW